MVLGLYQLDSAIARGTKPCSSTGKPYYCAGSSKIAMVKASPAWKYSQTRCMTFVKWLIKVSIDN